MTELQSKEGAELDKRGQRLKGQARSHAWSPGGGLGGNKGTTSRASGAVTASGGVQMEWGSQRPRPMVFAPLCNPSPGHGRD